MSLTTRIEAIEAILGGGGGPADKPTVYFAVYVWTAKRYWTPFENYAFWSWSSEAEPPVEIHGCGGHASAADLDRLAADGYTIMLLFDPNHLFAENNADIDWPAYGPGYVIPWAGYTPGDCLARVLNKVNQRTGAADPRKLLTAR